MIQSDVYLRQWAPWQRLSPQVQKKLVEDTKKRIKCLLRANGVVQDNESQAALEDNEANSYLNLKISGDEASESENNSDPEAGAEIEALVEGPDNDK